LALVSPYICNTNPYLPNSIKAQKPSFETSQ
jgi:hypothetical protein